MTCTRIQWQFVWAALFCGAAMSISSRAVGFTNNVGLPQFNPSLGNLLSVTLRYTGMFTGDVGVENADDKFNTIYGVLDGTFEIRDSGNALVLSLNLQQTGSTVVAEFDGDPDFGGASGYTFGLSTNGVVSFSYTLPAQLLPFIGLGSLSYAVSAGDQSYGASGTITPFFTSSLNGSGTLEITYTTEVIPEPGSLARWAGVVRDAYRHRTRLRREV